MALKKTKTIKLTYEEINTITCYILMTTKYREGEAEAWERLATEKKPDGSLKFPNAKRNAQFWRKQQKELTAIISKMED